ncbi:MAG: glycosyltransferase family 4 protein [Verrucomicrobiae bacterium]|nr:glycosyltransferase family 4 protein [Verrucomicrobiae bacterium]
MDNASRKKKVLIVWGNWGPYHYARFRGFKSACERAGLEAIGLQLFQKSNIYDWESTESEAGIRNFSFGDREMDFPVWKCLTQLLPYLWKIRVDYAFVPSYWHWSLFINFVCRIRGAKIIMMNESHADTEKADGIKRWIKKQIVKRFHAALLGGKPHQRHFANLGMKPESLFTGYDAIDVDFFSKKADIVRVNAETERKRLNLPARYILSLSRMVEKKNLPRLVEAYAQMISPDNGTVPHLAFVGSGPLEEEVRQKVADLGLPIFDHTDSREVETVTQSAKGVHFYGFRQIDDNPAFFTLAEAFIMPSLWEEWGLVVNEAMACSTPVLVAENAGCAEDLVVEGETGYTFDPRDTASITRSMEKLLVNRKLSSHMGEAGLRHVLEYDCAGFGRNAIRAIEYVDSLS